MRYQVPSASTLKIGRSRAAVKAQDELADSALTAARLRPKQTYTRPKGPTEATAAKLKSVNYVVGTKCKPCIGLDSSSARIVWFPERTLESPRGAGAPPHLHLEHTGGLRL